MRSTEPLGLPDNEARRLLRRRLAGKQHWVILTTCPETREGINLLLDDAARRGQSLAGWQVLSLPPAGLAFLLAPKAALPRERLLDVLRHGCDDIALDDSEDVLLLASTPWAAARGLACVDWLEKPVIGGDGAAELPPGAGPT